MPDTKPADAEPAGEPSAESEAKRRFREALERKQAHHSPSTAADPATRHPHTAPAKPSRTFRRKSG